MLTGGDAAALTRIVGDGRGWSGLGRALKSGQRVIRLQAAGARTQVREAPGQVTAIALLGLLSIGVFAAALVGTQGPLRLDPVRNQVFELPNAPGGDEPAPGSADQAWSRGGVETIVNPLLAQSELMYPAWLGLAVVPSDAAMPEHASGAQELTAEAIAHLPRIALPSSADVARTVRAWLDDAESQDGFLIAAFADAVREGARASNEPDIVTIYEIDEDGGPHVRLASAEALALYFDQVDFDLESIRNGRELVPRSYLASLPPDLDALESPGDRKQLFIKALLPVVLKVNEEIAANRERLGRVRQSMEEGRALSLDDGVWLDEQLVRYDVGDDDLDELARRMDIIPPSLALAQAAEESGWGTSRFAREGNALFGQYTDADGQGIAPLSRVSAVSYRIQSFDSLVETVRSYALNLNLHPAYREFRELRTELREKNAPLDGYQLAGMLKRYSERGKAYVRTIRVIIRDNDLLQFDGVKLNEPILSLDEYRTGLPTS